MEEMLMNKEEYKYKLIIEQLRKINIRIQRLEKEVLNLKKLTEENIEIDDKIYNLSKYEKIENILINSSNKIKDSIILSLMAKINS